MSHAKVGIAAQSVELRPGARRNGACSPRPHNPSRRLASDLGMIKVSCFGPCFTILSIELLWAILSIDLYILGAGSGPKAKLISSLCEGTIP